VSDVLRILISSLVVGGLCLKALASGPVALILVLKVGLGLDGWSLEILASTTSLVVYNVVFGLNNVQIGFLRVFDSFLELGEFSGWQTPVLVVIESLDEVDRSFFWELELILQNRRRFSKANVLSSARQPIALTSRRRFTASRVHWECGGSE